MIIQNEPVRGRARPTCRSPSRATTCAPRATRSSRSSPSSASRHRDRRDDGQGLDRRRGNEVAPGRRREGVHRRSASEGINIEMISTSPIKISCVIPGDRVARRRARAARRVRAVGRGHDPARAAVRGVRGEVDDDARYASPWSAPPARSARSCSSCCASAASRPTRSSRSPPSARRAASSSGGAGRPAADRRDDPGLRPRALLRRRRRPRGEWAPRFVDGGRRRRRQLVGVADARRRAARRLRGQPRRARRPPRDHRQPELLDDADGRRAQAAARRGGHRAAGRLDLPGGRRARARRRVDELLRPVARRSLAGDGAARAAASTRTRSPSTSLPHAGSFADGDDHTDEERKLINETRKILGDPRSASAPTCVRVPVVDRPLRAVNVETREPLEPRARRASCCAAAPGVTVARRPGRRRATRWRSRPPAATTSSSAASAATPATSSALDLWSSRDNLRKGAATNTVQLAELLHERGLLRPARGARGLAALQPSRRARTAPARAARQRATRDAVRLRTRPPARRSARSGSGPCREVPRVLDGVGALSPERHARRRYCRRRRRRPSRSAR